MGVEGPRHRLPCGVGDERLSGLCHRAQPGREVYGLARNRVLRRCPGANGRGYDLAAGDAGVQLQCLPRRIGYRGHLGLHVERCPHGPLYVVVVSDRRTEYGKSTVPGVIDHIAAVIGDDSVRDCIEAAQKRLHLLWVESTAKGRVAGDVGDQHGCLTPLAIGCLGRGLECLVPGRTLCGGPRDRREDAQSMSGAFYADVL